MPAAAHRVHHHPNTPQNLAHHDAPGLAIAFSVVNGVEPVRIDKNQRSVLQVNPVFGQIRAIFGDVEFELQVVGAFDAPRGSWRWEWADVSLPREVGLAAAHAKAFGEANEIDVLTAPASRATEADCWRYAAFAARLIDWPAIYRAPLPSGLILFVAFRPLTAGGAGSITISA